MCKRVIDKQATDIDKEPFGPLAAVLFVETLAVGRLLSAMVINVNFVGFVDPQEPKITLLTKAAYLFWNPLLLPIMADYRVLYM